MQSEATQSTIYFDGSCPLCRAEIGYYRRRDTDGSFCFVDVSNPDAVLHQDLTQQKAMARFHVNTSDGQLLSGAAAFVAVWAKLPKWQWLARIAARPRVTALLEYAYLGFLPVRPFVSRLFGKRA